jgi:hypothetical protein
VAAAVVASVIGGCSAPTEQRDLVRRLEAVDVSARFSFDYSAAGTDVLSCALPTRRFGVVVDRVEGVVAVRDDAGHLIAVSTADRILLAGTQFASPSLADAWVEAEVPLDPARLDLVRRALGVDVATYVLTNALPADGQATAVELVASATEVSVLRREDGGEAVYRVEVIADEEAGAPAVRAEIAVTGEGRVRRVDVLPSQPAAASDDAASGWTLEYHAAEPAPVAAPAGPAVDLLTVAPSALGPRPIAGCDLGAGGPRRRTDGRRGERRPTGGASRLVAG